VNSRTISTLSGDVAATKLHTKHLHR